MEQPHEFYLLRGQLAAERNGKAHSQLEKDRA